MNTPRVPLFVSVLLAAAVHAAGGDHPADERDARAEPLPFSVNAGRDLRLLALTQEHLNSLVAKNTALLQLAPLSKIAADQAVLRSETLAPGTALTEIPKIFRRLHPDSYLLTERSTLMHFSQDRVTRYSLLEPLPEKMTVQAGDVVVLGNFGDYL